MMRTYSSEPRQAVLATLKRLPRWLLAKTLLIGLLMPALVLLGFLLGHLAGERYGLLYDFLLSLGGSLVGLVLATLILIRALDRLSPPKVSAKGCQ